MRRGNKWVSWVLKALNLKITAQNTTLLSSPLPINNFREMRTFGGSSVCITYRGTLELLLKFNVPATLGAGLPSTCIRDSKMRARRKNYVCNLQYILRWKGLVRHSQDCHKVTMTAHSLFKWGRSTWHHPSIVHLYFPCAEMVTLVNTEHLFIIQTAAQKNNNHPCVNSGECYCAVFFC